jgi:hypothetical protein
MEQGGGRDVALDGENFQRGVVAAGVETAGKRRDNHKARRVVVVVVSLRGSRQRQRMGFHRMLAYNV